MCSYEWHYVSVLYQPPYSPGCEEERTMKAQQVLLLLHAAGHLHDGDGETVRRGCKHG